MPYLKPGRKAELMTEPWRAETDGDYNYLFTRAYIAYFIESPSYQRIATIRKAVHDPTRIDAVAALDNRLAVGAFASNLDRQVARELAWEEFYRRVGAKYEDECITRNGDLVEYDRAFEAIQKKFAAEVK